MTNAEWFDTGKLIVIRGSVYDSEGNPQSGILVSMFDTNNNLVKRVRTNSSGVFRFAFDKTTFVYGTYNILYGFQGVTPRFKYDLNPGDYDTLMIWNIDGMLSGVAANPWIPTVRYLSGAVVSYDGAIYKCILDDPQFELQSGLLGTVTVQGANASLTNSGIALVGGNEYQVTASGAVNAGGANGIYGPNGSSSKYSNCTYPNEYWMSLVGVVGGKDFQLGSNVTFNAPASGTLYLICDDTLPAYEFSDNSGSFSVSVYGMVQVPIASYPPPATDTKHWQSMYQAQGASPGANPAIFYTIGSMP